MPTVSVSCPFCNALVPVSDGTPAGGRVACPRCGDSFMPSGAGQSDAAPVESQLDEQLKRHREGREQRAKQSVRRAIIIAAVLLVAGVAVGLGISRWRGEPKPVPGRDVASKTVVSPIDMEGLRYLPDGTDSVIALQVRAYVESLGDKTPPKDALEKLGLPDKFIDGFQKVLSVPLEQVDQLVVGLKLNGGSIAAQPVLVVRTRSTFTPEGLAGKRKMTAEKHNNRTYYRTGANNLFGERFYWWAPNDHTLLIALQTATLDAIPAEGQAPREHLPGRLVERASALLPAETTCWAVLDSDSWETIVGLVSLGGGKIDALPQLLESVGSLNTATIGARVEEDEPIMTLWLDLTSDKAGDNLRNYLTKRYAEVNEPATVGGVGNRVMVRVPASAGGIVTAMQRALPSNKK